VPTYQYACTACDERLEAVQSFTDPALTTCPVCQGALRKVYSAVGVVFKGSGFYKNDSRDAGKKAGSKNGDSAGSSDKAAATTTTSTSSSSEGGSSSSSASSTPAAPAAAPAKAPAGKSA
jgi:putative FmdB family regulatory protein